MQLTLNGVINYDILRILQKMIRELKYYIDKIEPCNIYDNNGLIEICFHQIQSKSCSVITEFAKSADVFSILESNLPNDCTINYAVKFQQHRVNDIAFLCYCLSKDTRVGGCAIYNLPILEYWLALEYEPLDTEILIEVPDKEKVYYKEILEYLYTACGENINPFKLPSGMPFRDKTHVMQFQALEKFLRENHPIYVDRHKQLESEKYFLDRKKFYGMLDEFNKKYDSIYQWLLRKGEFSPKWKSEYEMFLLIKSEYDNAIYQYRSGWLNYQSLDVFVPSALLAFEYQGKQHYEPMEVFGGREHFEKQKLLDEAKRTLCKKKGVKLIEWKYDEPLSKIVLHKKLKMLDFCC